MQFYKQSETFGIKLCLVPIISCKPAIFFLQCSSACSQPRWRGVVSRDSLSKTTTNGTTFTRLLYGQKSFIFVSSHFDITIVIFALHCTGQGPIIKSRICHNSHYTARQLTTNHSGYPHDDIHRAVIMPLPRYCLRMGSNVGMAGTVLYTLPTIDTV